jgi:hypothetical protein
METGMENRIISVKGAEVTVATRHEQDDVSLTDMARNFDPLGASSNGIEQPRRVTQDGLL